MKRVSIASMGAIALIATTPFISQIPGVANIWHSGSAIAQNTQAKGQVQLRLDAQKQVMQKDEQGKEKVTWQPLQGKAVVQRGDVLRYTVSGENRGDRPVKNLTINQPIPQGMVYKLKSANVNVNKGAKITYSIDGGRSFVENPTVKVTLPNGKVESRPAPATAYTHIRLGFGESIAAKTTVKGTYEVQVP
ncbi:hypothetical protein [Nostoc sp. FACHB-888]|uniref:hypothetical protein n=1 Tax=Nostoc sp. FACHB-888 TaxID=2692842 RepID=UPI00168A10A2|nr:hypothetical protein [Nostoc sp. FACHB-888]MBD2249432.1 hypothetical protein [Nostoc sp. FACHB-888]